MRNDKLGVFPYPAESGTPCPIAFEYGGGVAEGASAGRIVVLDKLKQRLELCLHDIVIIFAVGIPRYLVFILRQLRFGLIVQGITDNGACPFY